MNYTERVYMQKMQKPLAAANSNEQSTADGSRVGDQKMVRELRKNEMNARAQLLLNRINLAINNIQNQMASTTASPEFLQKLHTNYSNLKTRVDNIVAALTTNVVEDHHLDESDLAHHHEDPNSIHRDHPDSLHMISEDVAKLYHDHSKWEAEGRRPFINARTSLGGTDRGHAIRELSRPASMAAFAGHI